MLVVRVGKVENRLLEGLHLIVHLVSLDMRLELSEVVHGAFAVGGSNHVRRVLPDVLGHLAPRSLDGSDGVSESAVLEERTVSILRLCEYS